MSERDQQIISSVEQVRLWLRSNPDSAALLANLPGLELALAAHVNNQDTELRDLAARTAQRLYSVLEPETLSTDILAALIPLYLRLFQGLGGDAFRDAARQLAQHAQTRYDDEHEIFRAENTFSPLVVTDANARLTDAFYFAWRVLDDAALRAQAGQVLSQVSALFEPNEGLYQFADWFTGTRTEPRRPATFAAAIQMLLTASETTARATYLSRALILAAFALDQLQSEIKTAPPAARIQFAQALTRLAQFADNPVYGDASRDILAALDVRAAPQSADYALALEHAAHFPLHLVVVGDVERDPNAQQLWRTGLNLYASARAIEVLDPQRRAARIQALGYEAAADTALAYLCLGSVCLPPVRSTAELVSAVQRMRTGTVAYRA